MKLIETIQKLLKDSVYSDGHVTASFDLTNINSPSIADLRSFYDQEANSWYPAPKKVINFNITRITNWRQVLNIELREFYYLSEYDSQPEKYKDEIINLEQTREQKIQELIEHISGIFNDQQYEVFELDIRLDGYYACYSKDYIFKTDSNYYILRARIDD